MLNGSSYGIFSSPYKAGYRKLEATREDGEKTQESQPSESKISLRREQLKKIQEKRIEFQQQADHIQHVKQQAKKAQAALNVQEALEVLKSQGFISLGAGDFANIVDIKNAVIKEDSDLAALREAFDEKGGYQEKERLAAEEKKLRKQLNLFNRAIHKVQKRISEFFE